MPKKEEQVEATQYRCPVEDCKREGLKTLQGVAGHLLKVHELTLKDFPDTKETCSRTVLSPTKILKKVL